MKSKFDSVKRKVKANFSNRNIKNKRAYKYRRSDFSKDNNKQVENSMLVKVTMGILVGIIFLFFILTILGAVSTTIAAFIWKNFIIPCRTFIFVFSQYCVFKVGRVVVSPMLIFGILLLIFLIINVLLEFVIPMEYNKKYKILNRYRFLLLLVCCYIFFINGFAYLNQNNPKLDTLYFKKQEKNKYKVDDIVKMEEDLKNKVIEYSKLMSRDKDGNIIYNGNVVDTAIDDLENASSKYDVLKGKYPKKIYNFNDSDFQNDPSTTGITKVDNVGVDFNTSAPLLVNTVTHELCHVKGVTRENEAVLCSVIVGFESNNIVSNYGAYLEAFFRTNDALSLLDEEKALGYKNEVLDLCLNDHYKEICDLYRKDTNFYVNNSDVISIGTYKLKSYDKEYINQMLDNFKEYKPELYINAYKKIKRKELDSYFENENAFLEIRIKNDKDVFVKVKKDLDEYSPRVRYLFQEYDGMYNGVKLSKKEAIKYYTASVPRGNVFSIFKRNELFDYTRSARLFLEYFDSKNV